MNIDSKFLLICGFPSSGTDLLMNILNAHSEVFLGSEFPLLPKLADQYSANVPATLVPAAVKDIVSCDIYGCLGNAHKTDIGPFDQTFAHIYTSLLTPDTFQVYGNKTPQNSEQIDDLEHLFPGSYYVLIVRDIRDVALSWKRKWGKDELLCAHKWTSRMQRAAKTLKQLCPDRHIIVRYEDLLVDYKAVAHDICDLINLAYDPRIDNFQDHVDEIVPGKINYGQPVKPANTAKWRDGLDSSVVRRIEEIAFNSMKQFGYPVELATNERAISRMEFVAGRARDLAAILFVGNRAAPENRFSTLRTAIAVELAKRLGATRPRSSKKKN